MRVDKYLWCIRLFKTRSQATRACKKGHVKVLEASVKPSRDVFPGDTVEVRKNQINYQIEILDLPPSRVGAKWVDRYRKDNTPDEAFEQQELLKEAQDYYRKKGTGRPTKKDRRDLEDFADSQSDED
ncbi:RNA-binding S4 domain-containing protein [Altibacter sp. HG106]|uniref:RNA-binding S4 domain-containing protein n=1 Tax=Altibacter sp. HG106 TaxID=3023937 RepID=UPI00235025F1|nr:S4 domain-containing protein [Altibacter sp. HG106]MDC7996294.1 S4 domain-containing protein [Altibacter sp. HG106]